MIANFQGTCGECGLRYPPGTAIRKDEKVGWVHEHCPDTPLALPVQPGEVACKRCFLIHPVDACEY